MAVDFKFSSDLHPSLYLQQKRFGPTNVQKKQVRKRPASPSSTNQVLICMVLNDAQTRVRPFYSSRAECWRQHGGRAEVEVGGWGGAGGSPWIFFQSLLKESGAFKMNPAPLRRTSFCLPPAVTEKETLIPDWSTLSGELLIEPSGLDMNLERRRKSHR